VSDISVVQIMLASYHGHLPTVQLLLRHGADPNTLNDRGQSPLAGAVFKMEEDVIKALLEGVSSWSSYSSFYWWGW
jgi:ankyrin repeat protein